MLKENVYNAAKIYVYIFLFGTYCLPNFCPLLCLKGFRRLVLARAV